MLVFCLLSTCKLSERIPVTNTYRGLPGLRLAGRAGAGRAVTAAVSIRSIPSENVRWMSSNGRFPISRGGTPAGDGVGTAGLAGGSRKKGLVVVFSVIWLWISFAPFEGEEVAIGMEVLITLEH